MLCINGSLLPFGPKTAIEKPSWSARFVIAPKAPHFHSDGLANSLRKQAIQNLNFLCFHVKILSQIRTILTLPLASSKNLGTNLGTSLGTSLGTDLGTAETESETKSQLLEFCSEPRSKAEIQEQLGIKSERYVRQILINSLLESGELIRTILDKTNSPKQRYVRKK